MTLCRLLAAAALAVAALRADARGSLTEREYPSPADGEYRLYDVWTPDAADGTRKLPAILFLHGRGGSRLSFQSPGYKDAADAAGVVLIFWQGRWEPKVGSFSTYYVDGKNGVPDESDVLACLDDAIANYPIDPERVHLAGFSQGGKGALLVGLKNPSRFASIVDGSGPSDAFQGQLWSPTFPDFAAAAGGPAAGATGSTLALWFAQSARFLLPNARNVPVALFHGTADAVVPDSTLLFPYRNTHHIADTPGFSDARGPTPTLSELHTGDPDGYAFTATYLPGVGHDEESVLVPSLLFGFVDGKSRSARPARVVARTYEAREAAFYWLRLARTTPPDGSAVSVTADLGPQSVHLAPAGDPAVTLDLASAGLDAARRIAVRVDAGSALVLRLRGVPAGPLRVLRDGVLLPGDGGTREGNDLVIEETGRAPVELSVGPAPADPVDATDLLVPALVDSPGQLGATFRSELVVANTSEVDATVEALLLGPAATPVRLTVPAGSVRRLASSEVLASQGLATVAAPLRLRVVAGEPARVAANARVFNDAGAGTYGLSFPVLDAAASTAPAGETLDLFGGTAGHPARTNLSLFAPFGDAAAAVEVRDASGRLVSSESVALAAGQRVQRNDLLANAAPPALVSVRVTGGRVQAYATVIDQAPTNDPFRSPALPRSRAGTRFTVPAVAAAPGRNGARFTSDLFLAAPSAAGPVAVTLTFRPRGGGAPASASFALAGGAPRAIEDVVTQLFPALVPAAGALDVSADAPLQVLAVTRSDSDAGPASQDLPPSSPAEAITAAAPALLPGIAESPAARTNLVLANGPAPANVALSLVTGAGLLGPLSVALAPGEVRQLDSVAASFGGGPLEAGALLVTPLSGSVFASAARIDNGTNDPSGIVPVAVPAGRP